MSNCRYFNVNQFWNIFYHLICVNGFRLNWLIFSFLLSSNVRKSINEVMPMIGARFYQQLETLQARNDLLENELSKVCEHYYRHLDPFFIPVIPA